VKYDSFSRVELSPLVDWLNRTLNTSDIEDYPNALNGLQLENSGRVTRVAAAVDAAEVVIERAIASGADLLIVHHGLFWSGNRPVTGAAYRKLKSALAANLAIYSSHLPLDAHPKLGNNALLTTALGLKSAKPFAKFGMGGSANTTLRTLVDRLESVVGGPVHVAPGGPERVRRIAVVSGGGGTLVEQAAAEGYDTLVTGEGPHHTFAAAEEARINLIYAGHYATETFGVKALAAAIEKSYGLPWQFIDYPSGL
jgi:dinuclear metal center YbgI/SA1388 family protein